MHFLVEFSLKRFPINNRHGKPVGNSKNKTWKSQPEGEFFGNNPYCNLRDKRVQRYDKQRKQIIFVFTFFHCRQNVQSYHHCHQKSGHGIQQRKSERGKAAGSVKALNDIQANKRKRQNYCQHKQKRIKSALFVNRGQNTQKYRHAAARDVSRPQTRRRQKHVYKHAYKNNGKRKKKRFFP